MQRKFKKVMKDGLWVIEEINPPKPIISKPEMKCFLDGRISFENEESPEMKNTIKNINEKYEQGFINEKTRDKLVDIVKKQPS